VLYARPGTSVVVLSANFSLLQLLSASKQPAADDEAFASNSHNFFSVAKKRTSFFRVIRCRVSKRTMFLPVIHKQVRGSISATAQLLNSTRHYFQTKMNNKELESAICLT